MANIAALAAGEIPALGAIAYGFRAYTREAFKNAAHQKILGEHGWAPVESPRVQRMQEFAAGQKKD